jgi:hypothetical protein
VDIGAHVKPRKRLMNMRMFKSIMMQMAIPEGVKLRVKSCVPVTGTVDS